MEVGEFDRIGGTKAVRADIRFVAATNRDLADEVRGGRFLAALYHRINVVNIHVPPLRERREDIPTLAAYFLERMSHEAGQPRRVIAPETLKCLIEYEWPGNVRELETTIERAFVLGASDYVMPDDLPETLVQQARNVPNFRRARMRGERRGHTASS